MILAGRRREVRRDGHELGAFEREDPVQLRKADVVTDGEPDGPVLDARDDGLRSRLLRLGLAVDLAADLDVEEVDLAVDGDERAFRVEDAARVRELLAPLAPLRDRAADERDSRASEPNGTSPRRTGRRRAALPRRDSRRRSRSGSTSPGARRRRRRWRPRGRRATRHARGSRPCPAGSSFARTRRGSGQAWSEDSPGGRREPLRCAALYGVWRSLVARSVRVGEVPSSNLGTPM